MKRKIFLTGTIVVFFMSGTGCLQAESRGTGCPFFKEKTTYILIIPSTVFSCPLCLSPYREFISTVQKNGAGKNMMAVFTYNSSSEQWTEGKRLRLLKKKIKGFVRGNDITFPVFLDDKGVFRGMSDQKIFLVVLEHTAFTIKTIRFPLSREEIFRIFGISSNQGT
ncbi:MAG: hypothetical protein JXB26_15050 [Candidatus Aminicenantes bacterium]|nr:hypothetical protein [Candidatus Aminicenantes bacterium]